ncbi:uncharacterized protein TrAFT101_007793 [Trichoderma asperellum]|nr:hypothetical protein TrAFT101_007793 [Trichoderma asperellum]
MGSFLCCETNILHLRARENTTQKSMLSLANATAPNTGKKRQLCLEQGPLGACVDSKRRRCETSDKLAKSIAVPAAALSALEMSEVSSAREQLSEEELYRGRKRWRAGSEPLDWDNVKWCLGDSMVASFEDNPEKLGAESTMKASTSDP